MALMIKNQTAMRFNISIFPQVKKQKAQNRDSQTLYNACILKKCLFLGHLNCTSSGRKRWMNNSVLKPQLPWKINCFLLLRYKILAQRALVHKLQLLGATTVSTYNQNKKYNYIV